MKAIVIVATSDGPALELRSDVPRPVPGATDLLVRVHSAGLNFADLRRASTHYGHARQGTYPIAGLEMAGEVIACGADVTRFQPGDRVMAMATGTYAEYACVDARLAVGIPNCFDWNQGAAACVSYMTAHDALLTNAQLAAGESVLVQAASSGAGIAATQIARHFGASRVFGTSTSSEKLALLAPLGLTDPINVRETDFADAIARATDGKGVDVIIDHVGGSVLAGNLACAAVRGRIVSVGRLGEHTGPLDLDELARKRVRLIGVTFRSRTLAEHAAVVDAFEREVIPLMKDGRIVPPVDRVFALQDAAAAQDYMKAQKHFGKVVLEVA
jgi:NADPH:quinone reductase-like Zn-dependent oxidoreductase